MFTTTLRLEAAQSKVRAALLEYLAVAQEHSVAVPDQAHAFVSVDLNGDIDGGLCTFLEDRQLWEVSL